MIGTTTVTVTPLSTGVAVDLTCLVDDLSIAHGRTDSNGQPEASSATINLSLDTVDDVVPPELDVGAEVRIVTTVAGTQSVRFVGDVTDVNIGWEDTGEDTPNSVTGQVMATNVLASLGRRVIGDVPWPQELDGARVKRIMQAAGVVLDPLYSDPGTVQILARDVDAQPSLQIAQEVASSAGGLVWASRGGQVRYADAEHRRNTAAALQLDACDVLVTPLWQRSTDGLINAVNVVYGVAPDEGERPSYAASQADSVARYGRYDVTASTELAALADAQAMATLLLTRNSSPVWNLTELPVDVAGLDVADTTALLALDVGDLVALTGLPVAGSVPTSTSLWVEGWAETITADSHDLTIHVSDYCRTSPPPRWDDVDPARTWDGMGAITWDGATCLGPQPSFGRWSDVPASLRWNAVPAATTWDTWEG